MLKLSHVSKRYGETVALAPTDLQVPAGKTLVLIGPSGCGKSTLLRLIVGLIQPDSGSITLDQQKRGPTKKGTDLFSKSGLLDWSARARRKIRVRIKRVRVV